MKSSKVFEQTLDTAQHFAQHFETWQMASFDDGASGRRPHLIDRLVLNGSFGTTTLVIPDLKRPIVDDYYLGAKALSLVTDGRLPRFGNMPSAGL